MKKPSLSFESTPMKNKTLWIIAALFVCAVAYGAYRALNTQPNGVDSLPPVVDVNAQTGASQTGTSILDNLPLTDYSKKEHWLKIAANSDKQVDVFYLYPTSWKKVDPSEPNVCAVDNPLMLANSKLAFDRQATAFETVGNIYAPYYKQDDMFFIATLTAEQQNAFVGKYIYPDVLAAFKYYLEHYNQGRPFILASHSQGSHVMMHLLSTYMKENQEVYQRMVAAYVIGYSITPEYLAQNPHLRFAKGEDDTGVIVSFNTEAPNMVGNNLVVLSGALVINPITWVRDDTLAPASQNLGSIMLNKDGSVKKDAQGKFIVAKNYADAKLNLKRGVVTCSTADVEKLSPGNAIFGKGIYHSFDYPFYYYNIRANAMARVKRFMNEK